MQPVSHWQFIDIAMLFIMWSIMMVGMMLPSAMPVILLIDKLNQQRKSRQASYAHSLFFVFGYLLIWTFYSLVITFLQYGLHHLTLLSPMMVSANATFSALLLIAAGLYQNSSVKKKCLNYCRSPLSFITTQWREGIRGAVKMGMLHGQYCLACCWLLMALLFVTGVMNLQWILILTVLVLIEKLMPKGELFGKYLGFLLIAYGLFQLLKPVLY
ncbi:MAG: DUF2182 domain-containing protein [Colwellia sp.]|nr:DUF2182 domain-containing protein [Colwellia sp.]